MTDPEHFVDEQPGALGQLLVMAGQDEEPPASLLERTLGSLSVGSGVALGAGLEAAISTSKCTTVSSAAATVSVASAPSAAVGTGLLVAAKYAGLGAAFVLATGLAFDATDTPSAVAPRGNAALVGSIEAPARAAPTAPARTRIAPVLPLSNRAHTPAAVSAPEDTQQRGSPSSLLREEAAVIDEAREAVATGNTAQALRALQAHHRRFARPLFQPEALYLEMQALRLQGDEGAARLVAERLLAAYPNGAQASAARTFLKDVAAGDPSRASDPK